MTDKQIIADDAFDEALDDATHAVFARFETLERLGFAKLPENSDDRFDLMVRINDALTQIMGDYRK